MRDARPVWAIGLTFRYPRALSNAAESAETDGKPTWRAVPPGPVISKDGWLVNPRVRCLGISSLDVLEGRPLLEAGTERGLVEAR